MFGVIIEWLSQLPEDEKEHLTDLIYDDNCHLARFATNHNTKRDNKVTKFFAEKVRKTIDKFHFTNHIDPWCIENCDPYKVKELDGVNTEICEQLFRKVNSHTNCKSMNEAKYFLFWLYNLDLHNLDIEDLVSASDPRSEYRWQKISIQRANISNLQKMKIQETLADDVLENLGEKLGRISLKEDEAFMCVACGGGFKSKGYLDQHMEKKHGNVLKPHKCEECDKILQSKRNLEEHVKKIHRSCKACNLTFDCKSETDKHKKLHSTCNVCNVDMKTKYKLERHMKTH